MCIFGSDRATPKQSSYFQRHQLIIRHNELDRRRWTGVRGDVGPPNDRQSAGSTTAALDARLGYWLGSWYNAVIIRDAFGYVRAVLAPKESCAGYTQTTYRG